MLVAEGQLEPVVRFRSRVPHHRPTLPAVSEQRFTP